MRADLVIDMVGSPEQRHVVIDDFYQGLAYTLMELTSDAAQWLDTMGDPYTRIGADRDGRVAIERGLYGVPETFVVDGAARVADKQIGAMTPEIVDTVIMPLIRRLRAATPGRAP